jgi:hypothetical protein
MSRLSRRDSGKLGPFRRGEAELAFPGSQHAASAHGIAATHAGIRREDAASPPARPSRQPDRRRT